MIEQLVYVSVFVAIGFLSAAYWWRYRSQSRRARERLQKAIASGKTEPVSLHPTFDLSSCIAAGACVDACPEGRVIGIVNGGPELVAPTACIGHGACSTACPTEAIALVFGTERRGVEIPHVTETFETNQRGIYIAGELGGMGLIRNAVTQGTQAIENIHRTLGGRKGSDYDLAIIGAGPAGMAATLQAEKLGMRHVTIEQGEMGGAILSYPRQKVVMTEPMEIPLYGKCKFRRIRKEELLDLWRDVIQRTGVSIRSGEKMESIEPRDGGFRVVTVKGDYVAHRILLAIGMRGTPRKLGVKGESSSKVTYKLIEPEQYRGRRVLVVGGGNSAVEAALALSEQEGCEVTLSYRGKAFGRIREANQERLEETVGRDGLTLLLESHVREIGESEIMIEVEGRTVSLENDFVIVMIGGEVPTKLLRKVGVRFETKFGER